MEQAIGIGIVCTKFHLAHTNILCSNQRNTFNPTKASFGCMTSSIHLVLHDRDGRYYKFTYSVQYEFNIE